MPICSRNIKELIQLLAVKVRLGAGLKIGAFEIGPTYVEPEKGLAQGGNIAGTRKDDDGARWKEREQYYQPNRLIMLVHRIALSTKPGQLYDIVLYLVPARFSQLRHRR